MLSVDPPVMLVVVCHYITTDELLAIRECVVCKVNIAFCAVSSSLTCCVRDNAFVKEVTIWADSYAAMRSMVDQNWFLFFLHYLQNRERDEHKKLQHGKNPHNKPKKNLSESSSRVER